MVALARPTDIKSADPVSVFHRRETELGDGYRRLASKGLNPVRDSWRVTWVPLVPTDAYEIIDMIKATAGVGAIQWTPPGTVTERDWTAESLRYPYDGPLNIVVSVTLKEFFGA